jgi:phospholipid transport system substrate-binding protein
MLSPRWISTLAFMHVIVLAHVLTSLAHAQEQSAQQVIEGTVDSAFGVLRDEQLRSDPEQRIRRLREAVDPAFDWATMAQSSLGAPWRELGKGERNEFVHVFKELLAERYMDDIDRFQGSEEVKVTGSDEQGDSATVKTTLITSSRERVPIDYSMHKTAGRWRVQDVSIEGVSLVNHYRKTFARYLTNKSFDELMNQLKAKLGPGSERESHESNEVP